MAQLDVGLTFNPGRPCEFVAKLQIQGLIWGSPYIELADSTAISSDTGYVATIDYKGKGESRIVNSPFGNPSRTSGFGLTTFHSRYPSCCRLGLGQGSLVQGHLDPQRQVGSNL